MCFDCIDAAFMNHHRSRTYQEHAHRQQAPLGKCRNVQLRRLANAGHRIVRSFTARVSSRRANQTRVIPDFVRILEARHQNLYAVGYAIAVGVFAIELIQGILDRVYPMVQGAILVVSFIFVFANLLVDVLYTVIDPRIRYD